MELFGNIIKSSIFAVLIGVAVYDVWIGNWSNLFIVLLVLCLMLFPLYLERRHSFRFSNGIKVGFVAFTFASLFLGEMNSFYEQVWWWDSILHAFAGLGLTAFGFVLLTEIYSQTELQSVPAMTAFFALCFSGLMILLWEAFEFAVDELYFEKPTMQPSNTDTMIDILLGLATSLVVSVFGYRYLKHREHNFVGDMVSHTSIR